MKTVSETSTSIGVAQTECKGQWQRYRQIDKGMNTDGVIGTKEDDDKHRQNARDQMQTKGGK